MINVEYKLLVAGLDVRSNYDDPRSTGVSQSSRRILRSSSINRKPRRDLASVSVTSAGKDNPYLMNLYEIENAIYQYKLGNSEKAAFQAWLNLKRQYVTKINPLNISFCDAWSANEKIDK